MSEKCLCVCFRKAGGARSESRHSNHVGVPFRSTGKAEFGILFDAGASVGTLKLDLMTSPPLHEPPRAASPTPDAPYLRT